MRLKIENNGESNDLIVDVFTPFEQGCFEQNIFYLQHKTLLQHLVELLKDGNLTPRDKQEKKNRYMGGNGGVAYLAPYRYREKTQTTIEALSAKYSSDGVEKGDLKQAILLFDVKLLNDCNGYYGNFSSSNYGDKAKDSYTKEQIIDLETKTLKSCDELCFPNSINLSKYLVEIWIHPNKKEEVIELLNKYNVDAKWLEKIVARDVHPLREEIISTLSSRSRKESISSKEQGSDIKFFKNPMKKATFTQEDILSTGSTFGN